jgi:CHAT domain-containing protein
MFSAQTLGRTLCIAAFLTSCAAAQNRPPATRSTATSSVSTVRQSVEKLLRSAEQEKAKGNRDQLGRNAAAAVRQAQVLAPGDLWRLKSLGIQAQFEAESNHPEKALALYEQVIRETSTATKENADHRFGALVAKAFLHLAQASPPGAQPAPWRSRQQGLDALAELLKQAIQWQTDRPQNLAHARLAVGHWGWKGLADEANRIAAAQSPEQAAGWLKTELEAFEKKLVDAGGQEHWASLGWLWYCELLNRTQLPLPADVLARLSQASQQPTIEVEYRARYWNLRGQWADQQMNYQQAYQCHGKALELEREDQPWRVAADRALFEAQTRNNLGLLHLRLGDVDRASELFEQAESLYRDAHCYDDPLIVQKWPDALTTQINLAEARKRGRQPEDYEFALARLQSVLQQVQPGNGASLAAGNLSVLAHNNLGLLNYELGRFDDAQRHFQIARQQAVSLYSADSVHIAEIDVNRGWLAMAGDRHDEAHKLFSDALATFRSRCGPRHPRTAECLAYLARVVAAEGQRDEATRYLNEALRAREEALSQVMNSAISERDRQAFVQELRAHRESVAWPGVLDTYLELAPALQIDAESQYAHVLAWKGILGRYVPAGLAELEPDPEIQRLALEREAVLSQIRGYASAKAYRFLQEYEHRLADAQSQQLTALEERAEQLSRELAARSTRFRSRWRTQPPTAAEVRAALADDRFLPAGSLLLDVVQIQRHRQHAHGEIAAADRRYVGFVVHSQRSVARVDFEDDADGQTVMEQINEFYAALREFRNEQWREAGARLAATIRAPLDRHLAGVSRLLVAADGWFHLLAWQALPGKTPGSFWSDELSISSIPSVDSLLRLRGQASASAADQALVMGDVDFGRAAPGRLTFERLDATADEVEAVMNALKGWNGVKQVTSLTGSDATEQALEALLPKQRLAHLATHGYFASGDENRVHFAVQGLRAQLDSALVMAGANLSPAAGQPDQLLTAEEIGRLDLKRIELVVLSACETGKGHFNEGQGLVGLLGAFDQAGAQTVVSSLWQVPDEATQCLMTEFYKRLLSRQPFDPVEALRSVQRDMANGTLTLDGEADGEKVQHPFYWAAWSVSGVPKH